MIKMDIIAKRKLYAENAKKAASKKKAAKKTVLKETPKKESKLE